MSNKLFVYGTLGPGRPNEHILEKLGGSWKEASVIGSLHPEGWGAEMGYPGITLEDSGNIVEGLLFSSDNLPDYWSELDEFEGEAYERVLTTIQIKNETSANAYIYVLKR